MNYTLTLLNAVVGGGDLPQLNPYCNITTITIAVMETINAIQKRVITRLAVTETGISCIEGRHNFYPRTQETQLRLQLSTLHLQLWHVHGLKKFLIFI